MSTELVFIEKVVVDNLDINIFMDPKDSDDADFIQKIKQNIKELVNIGKTVFNSLDEYKHTHINNMKLIGCSMCHKQMAEIVCIDVDIIDSNNEIKNEHIFSVDILPGL